MGKNKRAQRAVTRGAAAPDQRALLERAKALHGAGQLPEAQRVYECIVQCDPGNFEALQLRGVLALQARDPHQGVRWLTRATALNPQHVQTLANLGTAHFCLAQLEQALDAYQRALSLAPGFAGAWYNRGTILKLLRRYDDAADSFGRLREIAPGFDFAAGDLFEARRCGCDWKDFAHYFDEIRAGVAAGRRVDRPFSFLSVSDSAAEHLQVAQVYAAYAVPAGLAVLWRGERYGHQRIRIAYVSADFRDHVVLQLLAPILEAHDERRFESIGVSLTPGDGSPLLRRAQRAMSRFVDASRMTDQEAAAALRAAEIDIAVDLTGYTAGCRPGILRRRPAPVQVNFLGFPGTMGTAFIDYIIADDFVVPESCEPHYLEHVVRMPDTFQPNVRRSPVAAGQAVSRGEAGLPQDGVVLCSFNSSYKLNPTLLDIWTRVLQAVPGTVLWLLAETPDVQRRLGAEAQARGIAPDRVVFAPRLPYAQHLERLRLADLFLDTLPFNAGATAGDCLWAAVPLLTCAREPFASRMAGSLLTAVGLPELITFHAVDYERRAVELAGDRGQLAALKARLAADRLSHPLFDTVRYCRHLESAYLQMHDRAEQGLPAAGFRVAPFARGISRLDAAPVP